MLDRQQVLLAYQLILGREPESEAVIQMVSQAENIDALAMRLFASDEFRLRVSTGALPPGAQKWVCAEIRHGLRLWIDLLDAGVGAGALYDNWEADETRFVLSQLDAGDCFVDIGANIGWFTILAAHKVGKSGLVHAFEPRADLIGRVQDSVNANGFEDRCVLHQMALGAEDAEMTLASVPAERNPGHSFLMPADSVGGAVPLMTVPVRRLDDIALARPVKLIKLDVEGAEAMVIAGARELLARDKPVIVTEFFPHWLRKVSQVEPQAYLDLFHDAGYRLFNLEAEGPGDAFEALPNEADRADFAFNLVALPEGKIYRAATPAVAEPVVSNAALREVSEPAAWRHRLAELSALTAGWQRQVHDLSTQVRDLSVSLDEEKRRHQAVQEAQRAVSGRADTLAVSNAQLTGLLATLGKDLSKALEQEKRERERADILVGSNAQLTELVAGLGDDLSTARDQEKRGRDAAVVLQGENANLRQRHADLTAKQQNLLERVGFEEAQARQARQQLLEIRDRLAGIENSTIWKLTWPVRAFGSRLPSGLRLNFGRAARLAWWTVTLQLPRRLRERADRQASLRMPSVPQDSRPAATQSAAVARILSEAEQPVVVIIDDRWPEPDRDSGSLDAVNMIASFVSFGYKVIFAVQSTLIQDRKYLDGVRAMGAHPLTEADAPSVQAFIENSSGTVSLFVLNRVGSGGQFLELIRHNSPHSKIVFNTVDLHYIREGRVARLSGDVEALAQSERTRDREEFLTARSDLTIVVSSVENEILQASVPGANVLTLPLARAIRPPVNPFEKRAGIGFVGGFAHQPNVDAIRYFLSEVWPLVHQADPSIRFEIVGAGLPDDVISEATTNVVYRGTLDDLDGWFEALRLTVAPLRIGAGAKGKVASSLCAGLPCVVSPIAAEGMGLEDGKQILVGQTPEDMAEKIVRLYGDRDLWQVMSKEALALAESSYSLAAFRRGLRSGVLGLQLPAFSD